MPAPLSTLASFLRRTTWLAVALLCSEAALAAQDLTATAAFNPPEIGAGQVGEYDISVTGASEPPKWDMPKVEGIEIVNTATGFSSRFGTGESSSSYTLQVNVRVRKIGEYTVPAFELTAGGKKVTIPAATVKVVERPATPELITLTVNPARKEAYVGERLPIDVIINWRADLRPEISGSLAQDNDNFERVHVTGNPESTNMASNNQRYGIATWHTFITPLKSGPQTVTLTQPLVVNLPGQGSDPFGNSMLGASPFIFSRQQQVDLQSAPLDLNVLSLPEEGRPGNFTGGIGTFSVQEPNLSTADLQVGVPVTLTLNISGQGNFDRLRAPTMNLGSSWRSYAPKDSFQAQDTSGYHGIKTFEYVLMPLSANITELPGMEFNFFNPETKSYVALPLKAIPVNVKPAALGQVVPLPAIASAPALPAKPQLIGLQVDPGAWQPPEPRVLLTSPYFWAAQAVPAAALAGLVITRRRKLRLEDDPVYARRQRAHAEAAADVAKARWAAAKGDAAGFYAIAQRALQEAATHDRLDTAAALTWPEFDATLAARGASAEVRQQAHEIFEAGDALRFGGLDADPSSLAAAANRLEELVKKLLGQA